MKPSHTHTARRAGFTLVEMLVVTLIIGVLISLVSAAVVTALARGKETRNRAEISDFDNAVKAFLTKFKVDYIPSRIVLRNIRDPNNPLGYQINHPNPAVARLERDSLEYLETVWPRLNWNGTGISSINWSINRAGPANGVWYLEGDQCLVFFLGGMQTIDGNGTRECIGFATDPTNPTRFQVQPSTGGPVPAERMAPLYEFQSSRLVQSASLHGPNAPFVYLDYYGRAPFAYFSSYKTRNDYGRHHAVPLSGSIPAGYPTRRYASDCSVLRVFPYVESIQPTTNLPKYLNANTFQIISAGANGRFGRGSDDPVALWTPARVVPQVFRELPPGTDPKAGEDDQGNFHDRLLGKVD